VLLLPGPVVSSSLHSAAPSMCCGGLLRLEAAHAVAPFGSQGKIGRVVIQARIRITIIIV
jgi:hypothetical protein